MIFNKNAPTSSLYKRMFEIYDCTGIAVSALDVLVHLYEFPSFSKTLTNTKVLVFY